MNIYLCAVQKYIDANNADISDFKTLSASLGFETLDSGVIDWARSIIDKENSWLSNSINSNNSAIRKLSKKDNARRAFYNAANKAANTQLNLNNKLIKLLDNKREEYHRIDNSTRTLFQNGASFNYACENDYEGSDKEKIESTQHGKYDVDAGKNYDPEFRKNYPGNYSSLLKKGGEYDLSIIHVGVEINEAEFEFKTK